MDHLFSLPLYDMFVPPISLLEKMLRPLIVYAFLVARVQGCRASACSRS